MYIVQCIAINDVVEVQCTVYLLILMMLEMYSVQCIVINDFVDVQCTV